MLLYILGAAFILLLVLSTIWMNFFVFPSLPGPFAFPLIGNLHLVNPKKMHCSLRDLRNKYGDTFKFWMGPQCFIVVSSPDKLKQLLLANSDHGGDSFKLAGLPVVMGMTAMEFGKKHQAFRKLFHSFFNFPNHPVLAESLVSGTKNLVEYLNGFAKSGEVVEFESAITVNLFDTLSAILFGADMNSLATENRKYFYEWELILDTMWFRYLTKIPYYKWISTSSTRKFDSAFKSTYDLIYSYMDRVKKNGIPATGPKTALEFMIANCDKEELTHVTDLETAQHLANLLWGGHDSTRNLLSWAVYYLGTDSTLSTRLQSEVDSQLAGRSPTVEVLKQMPLLNQFLLELLRMKPSFPIFPRRLTADVEVDGLKIPSSQEVMFVPFTSGMDPANFKEPERVDLDRWTEDGRKNISEYVFLPFGGGARRCIGEKLAILNFKIVAAILIQNFEFKVVQDKVDEELQVSMKTMYGMRVQVSKR